MTLFNYNTEKSETLSILEFNQWLDNYSNKEYIRILVDFGYPHKMVIKLVEDNDMPVAYIITDHLEYEGIIGLVRVYSNRYKPCEADRTAFISEEDDDLPF